MQASLRAARRALAVAALIALAGFGLAAFGVPAAPPPANAVLETTSQAPLGILPQPSSATSVSPAGASAGPSARATDSGREALIVGGIVALIAAAAAVDWRRRRRLRAD